MLKRSFSRVAFHAPVYIRSNGKLYSGAMENVCHGGMSVKSNADVGVDENVEVSIFCGNADSNLGMTFPCKVARHTSEGFGLRSPHIDTHFLIHLEDMLTVRSKRGDALMAEVLGYVTLQREHLLM